MHTTNAKRRAVQNLFQIDSTRLDSTQLDSTQLDVDTRLLYM
jgi:hypothetical protein